MNEHCTMRLSFESSQMHLKNASSPVTWALPSLSYDLMRQPQRAPQQPQQQTPAQTRQLRGRAVPVVRDAPALDEARHEGAYAAQEQSFDVHLPADLFEAGPRAEVVFSDSHDASIVYGRFYIRQVRGYCQQQQGGSVWLLAQLGGRWLPQRG